jgi:hypothetical protein
MIVCEVQVRVVSGLVDQTQQVAEYAVLLHEPMDFHAGLESEQFAEIGFREAVAPVPLQSYRFEDRSRRVLSSGYQLTREFFRNLNRNGHGILLV